MSKNSPQLRFEGFTDDWEERKLGDITKISTGKLDANAMVENGKYDFYTSGIKKYRIDVAAFEGPSITIAGNGATVGYMHLADNKFNAYQRTYVLQEFLVDRSFIFSEIGNKLPKKIKQEARTGNIPYIVMDMLTELKLSIPQNNSEQQKIGSFFKQLDETIALHQRKLDLLKEQKKGYLQKMFPKNGAKVPELRFEGFADDWEERKLGEVATFLNGRAYKQDELLDSGKYKVLRVGNFYTNDSWYYSNMELGDKYYVDKGDLVYTWSATFGPHIWSGEKVIYHYHIWKVELSKFLDRNFTLQLLEADKARLLSSTNGSTMIHVTKGDMESKIVSIPNIDEQKQIGSFFKQLDNTITLHQRKLDLLKEQKKGFLQKMFA